MPTKRPTLKRDLMPKFEIILEDHQTFLNLTEDESSDNNDIIIE
jgi:hypothetical protein